MNFEPQKFFIGLVGFFSIIMPGALLAFVSRGWIATTFLDRFAYPIEGTEAWMTFLFLSYLFGHFAFLLGSMLDGLIYAPLRDATAGGQRFRLSQGRTLSRPWLRRAAASSWLFSRNPDTALLHTQRLKSAILGSLDAAGAINTYQWSKVRLSRDHPEGLLAVQRFEADSKFFRSFAVVLVILALGLLWQFRLGAALLCLLLTIPALWRYMDQRFKATQQAYWFVLMLESERARGEDDPGALIRNAPRADGLTHAGGVVHRKRGDRVEYLLVEATGGGGDWVLPKGHIEPFEDPRETAVREVAEEAGLWARILGRLGDVDLNVKGQTLRVRFHLMESLEATEESEIASEGRSLQWLPFEQALAVATHEESREMLARADHKQFAPDA